MDASALDGKYFTSSTTFNCPFCNRRNVVCKMTGNAEFDWSNSKKCYVSFVICTYCLKVSMHLSFVPIVRAFDSSINSVTMNCEMELDSAIFYSVPTSFFVLDTRIPRVLRELITEAEGCLNTNFLTGASACARKAIYELVVLENGEGENYREKITSLETKFPEVNSMYFTVLAHLQSATSDKIHEQSWSKWDSKHLRIILETLKNVLNEIYVVPKVKEEKAQEVRKLLSDIGLDKKLYLSPLPTASESPTATSQEETDSQ